MSMDWRRDRPPLDLILGGAPRRRPGTEWTARVVNTSRGRLVFEERVIDAPGGHAALQRSGGRLNGVTVDLGTVNELVLEALPRASGGGA